MSDQLPDGYSEPKTLDEAEALRAALATDVAAIQTQLGGKRKGADEAWRKRTIAALGHKTAELRAVKDWIKRYHRGHRLTTSGIGPGLDAGQLQVKLREAVNQFENFAFALEDEIKELQQENAALRARLAAYETQPVVAPGDTPDLWRDGYAKKDVA